MKVWIVTEWEWGGGGDDGHAIIGVYSTAEQAETVAARHAQREIHECVLDADTADRRTRP